MSIVIDNPVTGQRLTLDQFEFNRYMSQTNGAVLKWIVEDDLNKNAGHSDQKEHGSWANFRVGDNEVKGTMVTGLINKLSEKNTPGFTIDIRTGKSPKIGFVASDDGAELPLDWEKVKGKSTLRREINKYFVDHIELLDNPDANMGAWVSEGVLYLDVSRVYTTRVEGIRAGFRNRQQAIYDVVNDSYIYMKDEVDDRANKTRDNQVAKTSEGNDQAGSGRASRGVRGRSVGQGVENSPLHVCLGRGTTVQKHLEGKHDQGTHGSWAGDRYPENSVKGARDGAKEYVYTKGMKLDETIDYTKVVANRARASKIADAYDKLSVKDEDAIDEYEALASEIEQQFDFMTNNLGIKVEFVASDPYKTSKEMFADASTGKLKVLSTASTGAHPLFSDSQNDKFRAVHDYFGHAATGRGFGQDGEEAAWVHHSQMFTEKATAALTTETRGQNSWYNTRNQGFASQKVALLPEEFWQVPSVFSKIRIIKFEPGLKPVFKHGEGDQKPHGSWANYSSPQSKLIDKMQDLGPTQDDLNSYVDNEFGHNQATLEDLEFMVRNNQELYDEAIDGIDEEVANKMSDFGFDNPLTRTPEEIEQQRLIEFEQMQDEMIGNYVLNDIDKLQNLLNIENNNFPVNQDQLANSFMDVYNIEHEGVDSDGTAKTLESRINEVYLDGEDITVRGDIADENGDFAGDFSRRFFKGTNPDTGKETWNVEHVVLRLESEGTGFGKVFIAQSEAYYTAKGMGYIEVGTEWDGARHWARAGYDFDPTKMTSNAEKLAEMRVRIVQGSGTSDLIQSGTLSQNYKAEALAEFDSLMKRTVTDYKVDSSGYATFNTTKDFKSDGFPIPADFANIGYTKGAKDWVGKQAMYGLSMKYVKVLTAEGQNLLDAPIDRDGDGMIYDGTARERPAPKNN